METPVCFSHYFCNKQNVRSLGNIIKWKDLKNEKKAICKLIIEDSVSKLPYDLFNVLSVIIKNLRNTSKQDFRNYFIKEDAPDLHPVDKAVIFRDSWKALCDIIPRHFFGSNQNNKIFKNLIRTIVYSMKRQHFMLGKIIANWDHSESPWEGLRNSKVLYDIIFWILKYVLGSIICLNFYVTTCKLDANENKLYYFWKYQWQSYYDKQVSKMVSTHIIEKCDAYSLGKKSKRIHSILDRKKIRAIKKDIPKLHLTLKPNNDCRPIVCYKPDSQNSSEKYKMKERLQFLKLLTGKPAAKIEVHYNNLYQAWVNENKPKLYFIKTDLSNAFGAIKREKLAKIISERHMNLQTKEKSMNLKKKYANQYKDLMSELRKPFLIRAGSTCFKWKEGLIQGYKYSPALSELYYTHLDEIYFAEHLKKSENQIKLFVRVVDDYLYVTDSYEDALNFLAALSSYRNINYEKTVVNFPHENIKFREEIIFLGYCYNTLTLQVSRANNIYAGQMCYKIAFTSGLSDLNKFIESRIGRSGIQINSHLFNLYYNNEELIWRHVFTTFCLSANKFCTILAILCNEIEMKKLLQLYKKRVTVKLSNAMIEMLIKNKPGDCMFVYCINHFRYLSWQALYLCAKLTPKCSGLVPLINDELAKSNCIFGKWREHSRFIDTNGEGLRTALKEVCRRNDLKMLFKQFNVLPTGFSCYNHKNIK